MEQRNPRLRWLIVWSLAALWIAVILARLRYLQLFCYSEYLARAQRQQQRIFEISPMRGTIYDRKGRELAVSLPMDSVFADPGEITDVNMVARLLSRVLDVPAVADPEVLSLESLSMGLTNQAHCRKKFIAMAYRSCKPVVSALMRSSRHANGLKLVRSSNASTSSVRLSQPTTAYVTGVAATSTITLIR